ncbi:MAG: HEAT repeat domain-containing protein [Candidatus Coatesbacteria bacterium]|nr:MAG: HEAT repeat domain-containing protein [Candidatus Coatesbacteria bacterium]
MKRPSTYYGLAIAAMFFASAIAIAAEAEERKPPQDIYYLLDLLKSQDVTERRDTARTLGVMGFDVATPALVDALDDSDPKVQLLAAEALGKIGDPRAVDPLLAKLPYAETGVKRFILGALGKIGDNRALEALVAALRDEPVAEVRASAAYGLGELGEAGATEPLLAALDDENEWVRLEACGALRKLKATAAVAKLRRLAESDENEQVRRGAKKALEEIEG